MTACAAGSTATARKSRAVAVLRVAARLPLLTMAIATLALWLATVDHQAHGLAHNLVHSLAYRPAAPSLTTLMLCHVVHFSREHLLWDVLTFSVLGACSEHVQRARYAAFLAWGILLVPPLSCALEGWVQAYAGLSGLVVGQVALVLCCSARQAFARRAVGQCLGLVGLLLLLLLKQGYEYRIGNTTLVTFDYQGFETVPSAHLVSVLVGMLVGGLPWERRFAQVFVSTSGAR